MYNFLKFHDVSVGMYVILIICLILLHRCIWQKTNKTIIEFKTKYLHPCYKNCKGDCGIWAYLKDDSYFPESWNVGNDVKNCLINGWEISHFMLHILIGYFYNFQTHISISVGYEVWESYFEKCGSFGDLLINFLGFCTGSYLKYGRLL